MRIAIALRRVAGWYNRLSKWKKVFLWIGAVFVGIIVISAVFGEEAEPDVAPAQAVTTPLTQTPEPASSPTTAPTATSTLTPTEEPTPIEEPPTPTSTPSPTPTPTPEPLLNITLVATRVLVWEAHELLRDGIRVHFVARIENRGDVPAEVRAISYEMRDEYGALLETGKVPHSFPRKLGPGQVGVIGRTVTAEAAVSPDEIREVHIKFEVHRVDRADNLLEAVRVGRPERDEFGDVRVAGAVKNPSSKTYDNPQIAVVLVDGAGNWVGYATADKLPVSEIPAGETIRFVTGADLPAAQLPAIASVVIIGFDK